MEEIIYFEINNWFEGRNYPPIESLAKLINSWKFRDDEWCKENKLCVMCGPIDMSMNYCVAAPKEWVLENCPELLTDEEYEYSTFLIKSWTKDGKEIREEEKHTKKYSDFLCYPDEDGEVCGHIADDWYFPEYKEENFGVTWNNSWWYENDDNGDNEDEE